MPVLGFIGGLGPWEMGIILVIVLILFGAGKLPAVFKSFGEAVKAFRDGQKEEALDVSAANEAQAAAKQLPEDQVKVDQSQIPTEVEEALEVKEHAG